MLAITNDWAIGETQKQIRKNVHKKTHISLPEKTALTRKNNNAVGKMKINPRQQRTLEVLALCCAVPCRDVCSVCGVCDVCARHTELSRSNTDCGRALDKAHHGKSKRDKNKRQSK